ncbi:MULTISPECIES: P1 family peptidase [Rhodobacterales]|jgi:D-aminopeptidase|uniref:L-aminopeptidase/D-esterase-like protein n=1 Tax=Yoonia ponticola TaxID=1524255 RepID=A0A7W9F0Z8_9RHOB|nr:MULTISPECIES: P1 family peptidase [Rhodobacterales]AUR08176.1 L-aminopeptidase/D-esterase [Phaeobacter inhibens]MBB5723775.1 L-aminopeptidase/D-esterase-like protein [Yoonia ponticola]MDP5362697.1 P1 family peptidase [Paracoccaceae bacterium]|tara:strand:- start:74 stop:1198 length:1125 start_codon:yes stop_codon:yes gene_type:complete
MINETSDLARSERPKTLRARTLGLKLDGSTGQWNSITDVEGVSVGYTTLISGSGALEVGSGPIRTGVTAILPRPTDQLCDPVMAGIFSLNGNGELTGSHYIEETGKFSLPIAITNTHSCGLARDAVIKWAAARFPDVYADGFALPVAAETYDGFLNDINGFHVTDAHVISAIEHATTGQIQEGSVGGGTGMKCFGFKAGSGTSSRLVQFDGHTYTVGTFVQANFGGRTDLTVLGYPLGKEMKEPAMVRNTHDPDLSSIIVVVATDAPILPHQLKRLARRATLGVGKTGGIGRHGSGDIFLAFSTGNTVPDFRASERLLRLEMVPDEHLDRFFEAVVQSTEEAILNSMIANSDMTGRDDNFVPAIPHRELLRVGL